VAEELSDVLSEFARTMLTDFPIEGILDHLVERIVGLMPVSAAGVTLIAPGAEPRYIAASNGAALRFERLQTELEEGPCVETYRTGEAVMVPDVRGETRFPTFSSRAVDAGLGAVFTFPLRHGASRLLGALDLYREDPGELSSESLATAQTLADVASAYLINAQARADLQDASDQSRGAALHDALTGLPNRVLFLERLQHASLRARRSGGTSVVIFIDLNQFKTVNDAHGHRAGDELLVTVAERLRNVLRPGDTVARLSGDEFAILCEDLDEPAEANAIAARIGDEFARPFILAETEVEITASIGLAFADPNGEGGLEELLHDADLAMYRVKRGSTADEESVSLRELNPGEHEQDLAQSLPGAAERGELHLAYQPIVTAADGKLIALEALLRWTHPGRGPVPPTALIPIAERSGLILEIGRWVLYRALRDHGRWQRGRTEELSVSVNVSPSQLLSLGFVDTVATVLGHASSKPALLILEVTEGIFVRDGERALSVLRELKDIGVMLAVDDFGTGFSSISYLKHYPIDYVKIDREFVADLGRDRDRKTILDSLIGLAHGLGMTVIAEGVETESQREELNRLGCDYCQGFYFARPIASPALETLIEPRPGGSAPCLPRTVDVPSHEHIAGSNNR